MSVFWKKRKKKSDFEVNKRLVAEKDLKDFLESADEEFIKIYCFPAYLVCAYYFGTDKTKESIERLIHDQIVTKDTSTEEH